MIHTETQPETVVDEPMSQPLEAETEVSLLDILVVCLSASVFILRFVLSAFVLAIVVSLLLPVRYEAKIVLLPPQQNSSVGSALLGN